MYHFDNSNTTTTNNNDYYCNNIIFNFSFNKNWRDFLIRLATFSKFEDVARLLIRFTVYKHVAFSYNIILGRGFEPRLRRRSFQL